MSARHGAGGLRRDGRRFSSLGSPAAVMRCRSRGRGPGARSRSPVRRRAIEIGKGPVTGALALLLVTTVGDVVSASAQFSSAPPPESSASSAARSAGSTLNPYTSWTAIPPCVGRCAVSFLRWRRFVDGRRRPRAPPPRRGSGGGLQGCPAGAVVLERLAERGRRGAGLGVHHHDARSSWRAAASVAGPRRPAAEARGPLTPRLRCERAVDSVQEQPVSPPPVALRPCLRSGTVTRHTLILAASHRAGGPVPEVVPGARHHCEMSVRRRLRCGAPSPRSDRASIARRYGAVSIPRPARSSSATAPPGSGAWPGERCLARLRFLLDSFSQPVRVISGTRPGMPSETPQRPQAARRQPGDRSLPPHGPFGPLTRVQAARNQRVTMGHAP